MRRTSDWNKWIVPAVITLFGAPALDVFAATLTFEGLANGEQVAGQFAAMPGSPLVSFTGGANNLGTVIFDSTHPGVNSGGPDPDLLVNLGNVLILQSPQSPATTGNRFDVPNDSNVGEGSMIVSFASAVRLESIALIDVDSHVSLDVFLTDSGGNRRRYDVPPNWTNDISDGAPLGYDVLNLTETLLTQTGEGGGIAPAPTTFGAFNEFDVRQLEVVYQGSSPSGAIDNIVYTPEPGTLLLVGSGLMAFARRRRTM